MKDRIAKYRAEAADYRERARLVATYSEADAKHYNDYAEYREALADELEKELDTTN